MMNKTKLNFLSEFQKRNPEKFNEKIINSRNNNKEMTIVLKEILSNFEAIKNIKYLGLEEIPMSLSDFEIKNSTKDEIGIDIEGSRLLKVKARFEISARSRNSSKNERSIKKGIKEVFLYIPELIDNEFYLISGCKYYPIYQLIEAECYRTRSAVAIRTMHQPLITSFINYDLKDDDNTMEYTTKVLSINLFKQKISPFYYFFSKFGGFDKVIDYFKLQEFIKLSETKDDINNYYYYNINGKLFLKVKKEFLSNNIKENSIIVASLYYFLNKLKGSNRLNLELMNNPEYWEKKLGSIFTTNTNAIMLKNERIISSLERISDETTRRNMRLKDEDKVDIYSLLRWKIINFNELLNIDNSDITNKRIRIHEYQLYDFIERNSKAIYRLNYSTDVTYEKILTVFSNIKVGDIIKSVVKNDLIRYNGAVNTLNLFSSKLKGTTSGFVKGSFV